MKDLIAGSPLRLPEVLPEIFVDVKKGIIWASQEDEGLDLVQQVKEALAFSVRRLLSLLTFRDICVCTSVSQEISILI